MAAIKELLRAENDGTLSFGDFELNEKKKLADFEFEGNVYKVKTYKEITKLECNEMFVYESVPGTAVTGFSETDKGMSFGVEGVQDAQITLGVEEDTKYQVLLDGVNVGDIETNISGKLTFGVELSAGKAIDVKVVRC
uniref:hypothetical protein n=1 Tax=Eubacterium cellulosolvens TaxID=29322 RepID=UPI0004856C41|nr:hypothetical protein [[Eubacterium] cellulosolvens]